MFLYRPFEVVLTYFTSDSIFGSFISKIPPNHYQYKNPSLRKAKRNGIHYNLDISDIIDCISNNFRKYKLNNSLLKCLI